MAIPLPTPLMPPGRDSPRLPQMIAGRPNMKADTQLMKGIAARQMPQIPSSPAAIPKPFRCRGLRSGACGIG